MLARLLLAVTLALVCTSGRAADWPQWLGPTRDGVWPETGILTQFPAGGPKKLWSVPVGGGYSGPAVVAGKVYVTDYQKSGGDVTNNPAKADELKGQERVLCFDARSGKEVWTKAFPTDYKLSYPAGPRCTPTVDGGKVYAVGAMGNLRCHDAATGAVVWEKDYKADYGAKTPVWGFAGHPLVYGDLLIVQAGGPGSVAIAFDKLTGKEVWKALSVSDDPGPGYSSPSVIQAGGVAQLLVWHGQSINSLDPKTGKLYWSVPLQPNYGMAIMMPLRSGNHLFAGAIGNKAVLLELDAATPAVKEVWRGDRTRAVYPVNSNAMVEGDTIYAVDQPGQLRAVELSTGKRLWSTFEPTLGKKEDEDFRGGGSGTAFLVKNGDRHFLFGETGDLVIAKLTPEKYTELGRAHLVDPTGGAFGRKVVWSCPAFADKCVFARNDKELACFSLAAE